MADAADSHVDDDVDVRDWRYDQARRLGLSAAEAAIFAEESTSDAAELRRLVELGCDPHLAFKIVR